MPQFYGAIDLVQNELRNAVVQNLGTAPTVPAPKKGQLYLNSTDNTLYYFDGTVWVAAKSGAPTGAAGGDLTGSYPNPTIGVGKVTSTHIADGTIQTGDLAFTSLPPNGAAGGDLTGTYPNPTIGAGKVTSAAILDGTIVIGDISTSSVRLNTIGAAAADINLGGFKVTNVADPASASDAATKNYVDNTTQGLDAKQSVRAASTANFNLAGGTTPIDGVTVVTGNRVLLKNQTAPAENGIYVVGPGNWQRATDQDTWAEVPSSYVWVEEGSTQADTGWVCTADQGGTLGTTAIPWTQFTGSAAILAGAGLLKTGNTIDVIDDGRSTLVINADSMGVKLVATGGLVAGASGLSVSLLGAGGLNVDGSGRLFVDTTVIAPLASPVLTGDPKAPTPTAGDNDTSIATTAFVQTALGTGGASGSVTRKYAAALAGTASPEVVTHNLNTRDVQVTVLNGASPYTAVEVDWDATSVNTITIRYSPNLGAGYRVVVVG
jgi:hypothetical protein